MKEILRNYFLDLKYSLVREDGFSMEFRHPERPDPVVVDLTYYNRGYLPREDRSAESDHLIIIGEEDLKEIGIEAMELYMEGRQKNLAVILYEEDSLEHIMKDIWFFINRKRS